MQTIEDLGKFPSENPNPVLRLDAAGAVLYANAAAEALGGLLGGALFGLIGMAALAATVNSSCSGSTKRIKLMTVSPLQICSTLRA